MRKFGWGFLAVLISFLLVSPGYGQNPSPREELFRLVPPDTGFCLIVNNLRDQAAALPNTPWAKAFRQSPLGKMLMASPEIAQFSKLENDLRQLLGIGWPELRDDLLGDLLIFAYRPVEQANANQEEDGLLLLWSRKADLLTQVIDRLNQVQTKNNQLQELTPLEYQGRKYFRRVEPDKTHYYFVDGHVLAFSRKETSIREVIDHRLKKTGSFSTLASNLQRAHRDTDFVTLWLNPRAFDAELKKKAKESLGQKAQVLQSFLTYWKALDSVQITVTLGNNPEARLSLKARIGDMPKPGRKLFKEDAVRSELWSWFPTESILRVGGKIDAVALAEALAELTPAPARAEIAEASKRYLGAALGLDLTKDVLPNLGPDWGFCIVPNSDNKALPQMIAALAVKKSSKDPPVDQTLFKGVQFLAGLGIWAYNSNHADAIRMKTITQGKVEVICLVNDKLFPEGFQPTLALKEGFLLLASSPNAVLRFKKNAASDIPAGDNPILHLSMNELAKYLKAHRTLVVGALASKNQVSQASAGQCFDNLMTGLSFFDYLLLSERRVTGQVTWSLRLGSR